MSSRKKPKTSENITGILLSICMIIFAVQVLKADLTSYIFGESKEPPPPSVQIAPKPAKPIENSVQQTPPQNPPQTDLSGYEHHTDKNGNEIIIVPARYETRAEAEPEPVQSAPQQSLSQAAPLPSKQVRPARVAPVQAAAPRNVTLVAMRAANGGSRMDVFESCRCGNGLAAKGDTKGEVLEKCAQPVTRQHTGSRDCWEIWLYNFGPNEFMQGVCFDNGRVSKVLSLEYGY